MLLALLLSLLQHHESDCPEHPESRQCVAAGVPNRSTGKHAKTLPFTFASAPTVETAEEAEDIEVDLGLQQALMQSIMPSPAKIHTKGNVLQDISNWRLPTPASKQGPAKGRAATPLQALTGKAGW